MSPILFLVVTLNTHSPMWSAQTSSSTRPGQTLDALHTSIQLELLFVSPMGRAQHPSQSQPRSLAKSSCKLHEDTTTKPSKRWQPPRVTSTMSWQLNHLVLNSCNLSIQRTRIVLSLSEYDLHKPQVSWRAQALSHKDMKSPWCSAPSNGLPPSLFIEEGRKLAVPFKFRENKAFADYPPHRNRTVSHSRTTARNTMNVF